MCGFSNAPSRLEYTANYLPVSRLLLKFVSGYVAFRSYLHLRNNISNDTLMTIIPATTAHAADIAELIMTAMTDDCCQFLAGEEHTLDDFYHMMVDLVLMDDSQYSWRNAFVAVDETATEGNVEYAPVAGVVVGYDGGDLHRLRRRFQEEALSQLHMDYSLMDDETQPGEFYIDSLAVYPEYRRRGVATLLLRHAIEHASALNLPAGLLVDKGNPNAERLYRSVGFDFCNDATWGGHEMRHLRTPLP